MTRPRSRHALRETEGPWLLPEEGPWAGPVPFPPTRWGPHPIRTVREVHVADRRIIVRALGETAPMWRALGCHQIEPAPYAEIDVVDPRIGIVLALVPMMSPDDVAHWGLERHRPHRPTPGPAPVVFRIPKRIRGLGPWTFSQPIKAGYGAVTPIGARDALKACGALARREPDLDRIHASKRRRVRRLRRSPDHRTLHPRRTPDRRPARAAHRPCAHPLETQPLGTAVQPIRTLGLHPPPHRSMARRHLGRMGNPRSGKRPHRPTLCAALPRRSAREERPHPCAAPHPSHPRADPRPGRDPAHRPQGQGRHPAQTHPRMVRSLRGAGQPRAHPGRATPAVVSRFISWDRPAI